MAASTASILYHAGSSMLGIVSNNISGLSRASSNFSSPFTSFQQIRTFIQMGTKLKVVDNSGAKKVCCIAALKGDKGARLGDVIVASVREAQAGGKVKKGEVVKCVVVRAAMQKGRCDGSEVKFDDNAVVLVKEDPAQRKSDKKKKKDYIPIGTRVFGPVPHELRKKKHVRILSLAEHIA